MKLQEGDILKHDAVIKAFKLKGKAVDKAIADTIKQQEEILKLKYISQESLNQVIYIP